MVELYIAIIAAFMFNGEKIFGSQDNILMMVIMLMLLVLSAAVVGGLMVAKPILLYIDGKKKEAVSLFITNIISLFSLTVLTILIYIIAK